MARRPSIRSSRINRCPCSRNEQATNSLLPFAHAAISRSLPHETSAFDTPRKASSIGRRDHSHINIMKLTRWQEGIAHQHERMPEMVVGRTRANLQPPGNALEHGEHCTERYSQSHDVKNARPSDTGPSRLYPWYADWVSVRAGTATGPVKGFPSFSSCERPHRRIESVGSPMQHFSDGRAVETERFLSACVDGTE